MAGLPERSLGVVAYAGAVSSGALLVGLVAVTAGLPSAVRPQAVVDATCRVSPLCRSPERLHPAGRTYHRLAGGALALVGVLLVLGALLDGAG